LARQLAFAAGQILQLPSGLRIVRIQFPSELLELLVLLDLVDSLHVLVTDLLQAVADWSDLLDECSTGEQLKHVGPDFGGDAEENAEILIKTW
jgi:hypothetical protein